MFLDLLLNHNYEMDSEPSDGFLIVFLNLEKMLSKCKYSQKLAKELIWL